jgi:hypothetical protein
LRLDFELTNIRSKNIQLINAKNTVDVKGNVLQTKLDGTDIDGTREVAVRDRQVRIHRQQSIDAEIDSVRKSLRHTLSNIEPCWTNVAP